MPKTGQREGEQPGFNTLERLRELQTFLRQEIEMLESALELNRHHLEGIEHLISSGPEPRVRPISGPFRYANMGVGEAITAYLEKTGTPRTEKELIREVLGGGVYAGITWRATQKPEVDVRKSIKHWLAPPKRKTRTGKKVIIQPRLRQVGELIGLAEWPDSQFSSQDGRSRKT